MLIALAQLRTCAQLFTYEPIYRPHSSTHGAERLKHAVSMDQPQLTRLDHTGLRTKNELIGVLLQSHSNGL